MKHLHNKLLNGIHFFKQHSAPLLLGSFFALGMAIFLKEEQEQKSYRIIQGEGKNDFKNARILGNPTRIIQKEEELKLSRAQKDVLESQGQLKVEIEQLKTEILILKEPKSAEYGPQPAEKGEVSIFTNQNTKAENLINQGEVKSVSLVPTNGEEYLHTALPPVSQLETKVAVHQSKSKNSPGMPGILGFDHRVFDAREKKPGKATLSFPVRSTGKSFLKPPSIVLPSGSYVKAALLTGVEAPEGKTYPVLMQLDFAYIIPNDKKLDLKGCFIIAKAQGDLSTERVQMQATKLSCVSKRGGLFEREVNGFIADHVDNSFAVIGKVNSKQDRVAATAFLASIVAGIGKAIQQAQTTQQATPLGGGQSIVTGDQMKYIGAGGVSESASMVTQWYLKQAQNLLPTINIGSGQDVWVVMQDQVELPKEYFTQNQQQGTNNESIYSYFTKLVD